MKIYNNILELQDFFDIFIFDAYGVFWNGGELYDGILETFETLKNNGKTVCILSNTTKVITKQQENYEKVGLIQGKHYDILMTSGEYTRYILTNKKLSFSQNNKPAKYFVLGKLNSKLFENVGYVETKDIYDADCVYLSSASITAEEYETFTEEEKEHLFQLNDSKDGSYRTDDANILIKKIENALKGVKLPCFVANPDYSAIQKTTVGDKDLLASGAMAKYLMEKGYEVIEFGKPSKMIYDFLLSKLENIDKNRVCMVGDTLRTDIKGANNSGIKSVLCMETGITADRIKKGEKLEEMLKNENVVVDYFIKKVANTDNSTDKHNNEQAQEDNNTTKVEVEKMKFCYKCGAKIFYEAEICPKCGCRQPMIENRNSTPTTDNNRFLVILLLCIFLGTFGAHRFYVKKTTSAIVMCILTFTGVGVIITGIWWLIDLINIICGNFTDENGRKIEI